MIISVLVSQKSFKASRLFYLNFLKTICLMIRKYQISLSVDKITQMNFVLRNKIKFINYFSNKKLIL